MSEPAGRLHAFAPVVDENTRLLVLGSLPGAASLSAGRYYNHPQNAFWRLIGGAIGDDLAALAYDRRLVSLRKAGVGLWDVIASAERRGSLDQAIRGAETADLTAFVESLPRLKGIAFNGATAARIGRKALAGVEGLTLVDLPSSSPAYTRPFEEKAAAWRRIGEMLA